MPTIDWTFILSGVAYAVLTGIFNAIFANKSQINAWAEANPRLAGLLKITRALGLDPQHLWAAAALIVKGRLPKVQTEPLPEKTDDTVRIIPPLVVLVFAGLSLGNQGCSSVPITSKRCSFDNPEFSAHVALCRKAIEEECLLNPDGTPEANCPKLVECNTWREEQCR